MLSVLLVLLSGCGQDHHEEITDPSQALQSTQSTAESTEAVTLPGLDESIFEDGIVEATTAATEPGTEANTDNAHGSDSDGEPEDVPDIPDAPGSEPQEPQKPEPTQPETETQVPETTAPGNDRSEYESFQNMDPDAQQKYMDSFDSIDAFFDWYNSAREEHEQKFPDIEISDGTVDMGEIIGGNS